MGINERVEQLHRVLEAMNSWSATNDRETSADGPASGATTEPVPPPPGEHEPEQRGERGADDVEATLQTPPQADERHGRATAPARGHSDDCAVAGPPTGDARPATDLVDDLLPARGPETATLQAATDVAESLGLGYHLGSAVQRIAAASGRGRAGVEPLREAVWLIERYVALVEQRPVGADLHASAARLARTGDAIARLRALSEALDAESAARTGVSGALPDGVAAATESRVSTGPSASDAQSPTETTAETPSSASDAHDGSDDAPSFGHEIAFMAVRWTIMAAAVIVVVLAVTLIGQWA